MGSMSLWHWIVVLAVVLLFFGGRGKITEMMGDVAKGIKAFKKGMADEDVAKADPPAEVKTDPKIIDHQPAQTVGAQTESRKAG
jgi:sec-independent protein translocase protein TatA